jgi:hypothetical protein
LPADDMAVMLEARALARCNRGDTTTLSPHL